jgi:hypothetical protein
VLFAAISGVLNGLFKLTALWKMPRFYTATILLLYSANDIDDAHPSSPELLIENPHLVASSTLAGGRP